MSNSSVARAVHPTISEGVRAAFEEREDWRTKIAAAVRLLPKQGAQVAADDVAAMRRTVAAHAQAAIEHLAQAMVINQALMATLGAQFEQMPETHEKHCAEIGAAIQTPSELELQDALEEALDNLRRAYERFTE